MQRRNKAKDEGFERNLMFDMIIVGGGLVGAGFAAALADTTLNIALIDARLPSSHDARLFALNYGSCQFLKNLKLWQKMANQSSVIHQVHVSHRGRFGAVRLNHHEAGLASLGYVVPAKYIEHELNQLIARQDNLTIYRPATLRSLQQVNDSAELEIDIDGKEIKLTSAIVMGADGAASTVRQQAEIEAENVDYQQTAIVTRTQLRRSHQQVAYERFTDDGAIAMLPLNQNECATIWSCSHQLAENLLELDDGAFLQALQHAFGYRLGRLRSTGKRAHYPLKLVRAKTNHAGSVFLLGNAAHTVHPIAAQGFNLAIYEVAALADAIKEKLNQAKKITMDDLLSVSDKINKQQGISINVSHKLADIFMSKSRFKQSLLQLGMLGLDFTVPAKKRFLSAVLGRTGSVPTLLMDELA